MTSLPDTRYTGYFADANNILEWFPKAFDLVTSRSDLILITSGLSQKEGFCVTEGNLKFDARLRHRVTGKQFLIKFGFQNSAKRGNVVYEKAYKYLELATQVEETEGKFGLFFLSRENDYMGTMNHTRLLHCLEYSFSTKKPLLYFYDNSWDSFVKYTRKLATYFHLPLHSKGPKTGKLI